MLEDALFESQSGKQKRNPLTVVVSAVAHVAAVGGLVLIPLLQTQALTLPPIDVSLLSPRIEKPVIVRVFTERRGAVPSHTNTSVDVFTEPRVIPDHILTVDAPLRSDVPNLPIGDGPHIGTLISNLSNPTGEIGLPLAPPSAPPAPPPAPPAVNTHPIRVNVGVQAAKLIYQVKPTYPALARQARVQGVVVLEAVINKEGAIESLRVVSGHQLLNQAALDAAKQWRYQPTLLSGDPVDVVTTITVTFTLQ